MHLEKLYLANFKNYEEVSICFSPSINVLAGENGSGKTNLLEAIYFLSVTKSAFGASEQQCIRHEQGFYSIIGEFYTGGKKSTVSNSFIAGKRKKIQIDENPLERSADIIGMYPVVLMAPGDHELVMEGSEMRRKFIDSIIAQIDRNYLIHLLDYNQALKQRNQLIRHFSETGKVDKDLLDPYDNLLISIGKKLCAARIAFCRNFLTKIERQYQYISDGKEKVHLQYQSDFQKDRPEKEFRESLSKDLALQRTTTGVHRDEYVFEIDGYSLRRFGSQGQQKSFLIALKLAHFDTILEEKRFKPILLLDDIFDKLDDQRIGKLTEMIEHHDFGQVFITDARPERSQHFLQKLNIEWRMITVNNGNLSVNI